MRRRPCWYALAALLLVPWPSAAQMTYAASAAQARERPTVVALSIRVPVGSRDDQAGFEATAWLLGHTLTAQANQALNGTGARVRVAVDRDATTYTLSALPTVWRGARRTLERVLFDDPLSAELFELERRALSRQLAFRAGSPVADFQTEWVAMIAGESQAWARAPRGTLETVGAVGVHHAELMRGNGYASTSSTLAVVGVGVDSASVAGSEPGAAPDRRALQDRPTTVAWTEGTRTELVQEVTSAWIAVAYPAPSDLPRTTLDFVAHLVGETLDPVPPDPARYSVDVRVVDAPGGPVLLVEAAVIPEAADRWEGVIFDVIAALQADPPTGEFFRWARRRFRAQRLVADAAPEVAAARTAADLARDGRPRALAREIEELSADEVASAVRALGAARIFRLGPDLALTGR